MSDYVLESAVEEATLDWFAQLGYQVGHGPAFAPDSPNHERTSYAQVILLPRLRPALERLNPHLPGAALDEVLRKIIRTDSPSLIQNNRTFHRYLAEGVDLEYQRLDGTLAYDKAWLLDFSHPANNDWLVVNQFVIVDDKNRDPDRRPDLLVFVNGLPLAIIELKNPLAPSATLKKAFNQLQTYKTNLPALFHYNEALVISDGQAARLGTLTGGVERFMPWRTIDGSELNTSNEQTTDKLEVLIKGIFDKTRFLDLLRYFIVFETDGSNLTKKIAGYHQYHAANKAVLSTVKATAIDGDKRAGVVWHTQGSGKSLTMTFYTGKIVQHPALENPTVIVLTDRNDLDDQLFATFSACKDLLRQTPVQARDRDHLKELLQVASGGIIFTTIQKFQPEGSGQRYPKLSDRRNIIFIADEAHRSQYNFDIKTSRNAASEEAHLTYGLAQHLRDALPNATFIGFTGTPIESSDVSTRRVFGKDIDIYDIRRSIQDEATVPIYYEARMAKVDLDESQRPRIDPDFEEITEGEEFDKKEELKKKWSQLEVIIGAPRRLEQLARDLVAHFENRQQAIKGKAMIVCMSRDICARLYQQIIQLRPEWHNDDDTKGAIKVVITGSAMDSAELQPHIRSKSRRELIAKRFKNPDDELKLVIVRDMWLTGFDVPSLHTMYIDKPMQGHNLMQAIARVNRVFRDKNGGLIVDYLGIQTQLASALAQYSSGDRQYAGINLDLAVETLLKNIEIVRDLFHGFDYSGFVTDTPKARYQLIIDAMEFISQQPEGKKRLLDHVAALSKAYALSASDPRALALQDEIGFFQAVRLAFVKNTINETLDDESLDLAIQQIVSRSISSDEVLDLFSLAGVARPNVSILSEQFLENIEKVPQRNVALEALRKLLNDEIKSRSRRNLVLARSFESRLEETIRRYQNGSLEAAQILTALINLARDFRDASQQGHKLNLTDEEFAFYTALADNESAKEVLGDETLSQIARELVDTVRRNVTIDWTVKESVRAKLRVLIKRLLNKYGYPPDKREAATQTVLQQAQLLGIDWVAQ